MSFASRDTIVAQTARRRWLDGTGPQSEYQSNELHHNNVISQSTRHFLHLSLAPGSLQLMLSMTGRVDFSIEPPCVYACGQIDHPPRARTQGFAKTAGTRAEGRTTHPLRALLHTCIHRSLSRPCDGNAREVGQCLTCSLAWRTDRRDAFLGDAAFGVDGSSHGRRGCVQPCRTVGFRHRRCHCGGGGGRGHAALVPLNPRRWRRRGRATLSCSRVSLALTHRNATGPPCSPVSGGAGRARGLYLSKRSAGVRADVSRRCGRGIDRWIRSGGMPPVQQEPARR